jgi:hypothetical protein
MDVKLRDRCVTLWRKCFGGAELPIVFYYTDREGSARAAKPPMGHRCLVAALSQVRKGSSLRFDASSVGCDGAKRSLGFSEESMPDFGCFPSPGVSGTLSGGHHEGSPGLGKKRTAQAPVFRAPARFLVFKRWDTLQEADDPEVVIFFARPDVVAGLFTLAHFDEVEPNGVFSPRAAGCSSIVRHPYLELDSERPRAVLGLFDVSARAHVPSDIFTFSVPMDKFRRMIEAMEEGFLATPSWRKVIERIV